MRNVSILAGCCLLLALVFSCKSEKNTPYTGEIVVRSATYKKTEGKDCDKPDTLRTSCASLDLSWPVVEQGSAALKKAVSAWTTSYLAGILAPETDVKKAATASIEAIAAEFIKAQQQFAKETPDSPMAYFMAESKDRVLLNDGKYLTLEIEGYTYMGGAHGSPTAAVATFDAQTGRQLTWTDLVNDTAALKSLAEKAFMQERADLFKPTDGSEPYQFDENFPFALAQNYGLTANGIYSHYLHYEVGPYAIGNTQFTLPFTALGTLLKITPPTPPADNTETVPDYYQAAGDSLVIPTFEIEVSNSPAAAKTLPKKKETIIVAASFFGEPSDDKDRDEIGRMGIVNKEIELAGNKLIARFEGIRFSKQAFAKLADKDISLLINVYSGRKSSQDNLLDCGLLEMKASQFGNKRFVIGCKLIQEKAKDGTASSPYPIAAYTLPQAGAAPALLVTCNESGEIEWAGRYMKDYDALKAALRTVLADLMLKGVKELPNLETQGCLMGNSGEIRSMYTELKEELQGKKSPGTTVAEKPKPAATKTPKLKTNTKTTATSSKPATKSTPVVALNQKGEITLDGKKVTLENLRKELQAALLALPIIPDKLELKTSGETGMGMRAEVRTLIDESIAGAKWVRKRTAIEALNTPVSKKLKTSTQLEINAYQNSGIFAYINARPKQADGKAIDYSKTDYSKDAKSASFADNVIGLLKYENGNWKVLTYSIGVSTPPVDVWVKNYQAPKALFGK